MCPIGFIDLPLPIFPSPYPLYSAFPSPAPSSQLSGRPPSLSPPPRFLVLSSWLIFAKFLTPLSSPLRINCSVVQGSGTGPVAYILSTSNLRPSHAANFHDKYADDIYLIVPASNESTTGTEISHIEQWAEGLNLKLNLTKSREIILYRSASRPDAPPLLSPQPVFQELTSLKF